MSKLWGGRFSEAPNQHMRALNDSISFDVLLYGVDIQGSLAYAEALEQAGILTEAERIQIQTGLRQVLAEFEADNLSGLEDDEDIHSAVERRLTELIGAPAAKLHTGRSRNDQVATDLKLWLMHACEHLKTQIRVFQTALLQTAEPQTETIMAGYTHFQPAQPITAAHWLMSFFWMLERDYGRFGDCLKRVNVSPLGSSALAGTPYPINREQLAADLGFAAVTQNSLDAVSDRDGVAEFLFAASLLGTHLSRLAEDVIIYANPALGFLKLPDAYSTGSSIMPQKRNADPMELTRGKAGRVIGNLTGFLTTLKGLPSGYNKDLQEDKEPLFDTVKTFDLILPVLTGMIRELKFNAENLRRGLDEGLLATELADYLVLTQNLPFREAHHLVGQIVKVAEEKNLPLSQLALSEYQQISPLFEADIADWLNFEAAIQKRKATGGTSPQAVQEQIRLAKILVGL